MKKTLLFATILMLCASMVFPGGGRQTTNQRYNTTYTTEARTLNYFLLLDTTGQRVAANTMDGLVENDRYGRFVPSLAETWSHNDDYTVWTFNLRRGVPWVNSRGEKSQYEVTAQDFVEGLRYVADHQNDIRNIGTIRRLIGGLNGYYWDLVDFDDDKLEDTTRDEILASFDEGVGVKALDTYTVQYTLTAPTPYFLSYLVTELFFPVKREFLDSVGTEDFGNTKEQMLFNGGYYLADWQRDRSILMRKNTHYWDADNITVAEVQMQKVADGAIGLQMFQRGEVNTATLQGDQVLALQGTRWENNIYLAETSSVTFWFAMNFTTENPEAQVFINNLNFRKALYHAIDRSKLLELYSPFEPSRLLRNTIIPEDTIFDESGRDYTDYPLLSEVKNRDTYNLALARDYFAKAVEELVDTNGNIRGVQPSQVDMLPIAEFSVDGKLPVQLLFVHSNDSTDTREALLLQAMLRDAFQGQVELVLGQYVDSMYNEAVQPRRFDMVYDSFRFSFADPMAQLGRLVTDGSVNDGQFSNAQYDALVARANETTDIQRRYELFSQAERMLIDNVYVIPWRSGGGSYSMSYSVPFTYPRGGFGTTRFKYKGMELQAQPITTQQYNQREAQFREDLRAMQ